MSNLVILIPGKISVIQQAGTSVLVADDTMGALGGIIVNPLQPRDQGIAAAESLFVSLIGPARLSTSGGTVELAPGQQFLVPKFTDVWVNAQTTGHKFTSYFSIQYTPQPVRPVPGMPGYDPATRTFNFPPGQVTGLTQVIGSYLYQEYSDDDDLQGFVESQNEMQQNYVDTFNALNLPIYPGPIVSNKLLDWVAEGVYGFPRPALSSGKIAQLGPLNTFEPNQSIYTTLVNFGNPGLPLNTIKFLAADDAVVADDDTYRRCITWHFYKGDGKYFCTSWLKRRVWRFIFGENGWSPEVVEWNNQLYSICNTDQISVSMGVNRSVCIRFVLGIRTVTGGAMLNAFGCNGFGPPGIPEINTNFASIPLNDLETTYERLPSLPYMQIFKEALEAGVLEVPYQFNFNVVIG